jgi:hypothetical protein
MVCEQAYNSGVDQYSLRSMLLVILTFLDTFFFVMPLDIYYVQIHNKSDVSRNFKMTSNMNRREYMPFSREARYL